MLFCWLGCLLLVCNRMMPVQRFTNYEYAQISSRLVLRLRFRVVLQNLNSSFMPPYRSLRLNKHHLWQEQQDLFGSDQPTAH